MRLTKVRLQRFRNFTDAQTMAVEPDVTCLVGKNESGKTTILKALHRLNPANRPDEFTLTTEYPRRRLARDRRKERLEDLEPILAWFALEPRDVEPIAEILGFTPPDDALVRASRSYDNAHLLEVECGVATLVRIAGAEVGVDPEDVTELADLPDIDSVRTRAGELAATHREARRMARATALRALPKELERYDVLVGGELTADQQDQMMELLPKFFYFSNYELLKGETDLEELATRIASGDLADGDETMVALLTLAGQEPKSFLDEEYVTRKAELQAASSDLTQQVMKYWKQNDTLSVRFDTDMPIVGTSPYDGSPIRHRFLKVELHDARHDVDTNFETRSAGFQWFFSFLAAFSVYQESNDRVVVLLDEPGTSLHGEAQRDFLSYIFNELGTHQQVLYTTHSQHMLDPTRYETMRAVHDRATRDEPELGVVITPVDLSADRTTILPVEAALGYTVAQHLFLGRGPHLAVEGSSDFVFLIRMSGHLTAQQRTGLDPRISIIPVGGVTNMPVFIALFGRRLDVRALVDGAETNKVSTKIRQAAEAVGVDQGKIVILGETPSLPNTADIEDLFTVKDYLWLYNRTLPTLAEADLPQTPEPILRRISKVRGDFDHAGPAHVLTQNLEEFFAQVDPETLDRFEKLFTKLPV
ncbi:ATP-dependent endonuclease [Micromonospora parva]|uniref:ATP-dependent nuclease n=1 Tax=Micromonospora parva TaxID=1464048 RepID=UPI003710546B